MERIISIAGTRVASGSIARAIMIAMIILFCMIAVVSHTYAEGPNDVRIFVRGDTAVFMRVSENTETLLYRTQKDYIATTAFRLSPDRIHLAIIETTEGIINKEQGYYDVLPRNNLVICDLKGTVLRSTDDDVRNLSWSPDGSKIAYITGTYREGPVFRADGALVLDVETGDKIQIIKDFPHQSVSGCPGVGYSLNWATHDGNIYIQDATPCGGNYMYNTQSGKTVAVPYKGIHFSPDGKYYLAIIPEDGNYLYETATNRDITDETRAVLGGMPYSWILDRDHHLYGGKTTYVSPPSDDTASERQIVRAYAKGERKIKEKRVLVYDVEKREIVEEWVEKP
ncbi:MAG: PD40 domain-containing protein [candidate division Zixibacteria bacterium]|nr:PD40 domain-containing protein [candidate division Zixibacteria bacterium]